MGLGTGVDTDAEEPRQHAASRMGQKLSTPFPCQYRQLREKSGHGCSFALAVPQPAMLGAHAWPRLREHSWQCSRDI